MTLYAIAKFLHIIGALGLFVALAFEWLSWTRLRRSADPAEAATWLKVVGLTRRIAPASLGLLLVFGLYMTATVWGWTDWVVVGLVSLVVYAAIGGLTTGRLVPGIERALRSDPGVISREARERMSASIVSASVGVRIGLALGVVFVMSAKPDVFVAIGAVALAAALGLASLRIGPAGRAATPARLASAK